MSEEQQPTIDERLEAVVQSLELMQLDLEAMRAEQKRLDARERRAREALLAGIVAYFTALKNGDDHTDDAPRGAQ
jgi:hypothetical protein